MKVKDRKNASDLDTLAQLGTTLKKPRSKTAKNKPDRRAKEDEQGEEIKLKACTSIHDKKVLKKRARRNYFTTALSLQLVTAAQKSPSSILEKAYWNTYHCCSNLTIDNSTEQVTAEYCKNRWCLVCNAIRTAKLIGDYQGIIDTWENKCFVTLTRQSVKAEDLRATIDEMQKTFTKIKGKIKKRHQRGQGAKLIGLRKLECNYNYKADTFNPHYHLILSDKEVGEIVINEWYTRHTREIVNSEAQNIKPADDNACVEMFKYFTKVITKVDKERRVFVEAMDVIFNAIKGRRTFQPFGFKKAKEEKEEVVKEERIAEITKLTWIQDLADWADMETGELLSGYIPAESWKHIVEGIKVSNQYEIKFNK